MIIASRQMAMDQNFRKFEDETREKVIDLIWKSIDGQLKIEQLIHHLNELKDKYGRQFESLVADVLSIIDVEIGSFLNSNNTATMVIHSSSTETVANDSPSQKKDKFYSILNSLRQFIGDDLLKERLEIETLESLKLIVKKEIFNQKYIKIKTRLFYKQQKFNLLREESEGYSKLITELGQTNLNAKILENIQSLIGCFNLDPNRVLDIILESFENQPSMYENYIALLKHYKPDEDTICQIVGFKFQSLSAQRATEHLTHNSNNSLYKITAYLLKHQLIDLDALLAHISPTDVQIAQTCKEELEAAKQYATKLSSIQLSTTGDSSSSSTTTSSNGDVNTNQAEPCQLILQYQQMQAHKPIENQRVNLVTSLVEIEDYVTAIKLIEKMPNWYLATNCDVTIAICRSLDRNFIDSMYKRYNLLSGYLRGKYSRSHSTQKPHLTRPLSSVNENVTSSDALIEIETSGEDVDSGRMLDQFVNQILPILTSLGPGLSYDPCLFTKLIRICQAFLDEKKFTQATNTTSAGMDLQKEQTPPPQTTQPNGMSVDPPSTPQIQPSQLVKQLSKEELAFYNQIYTMLNEILLPSLSMLSMNPCLAIEVWNLLKLFPYEMRYNLYHNWRLLTYKLFPALVRAKAECQEKIKYLLKRLTKENVKIHGRQIGKLSHNNPIIVCDYILAQIQRYDNFILPVVESLKFMTPLSYDMLSYCIIVAISDAEKDKMKHDSTNLSTWLQSIATFCALAFKKYPIELIAMIQFVINQLKTRKSYDLLILQEIVQKMSGIEVLSEVNDLQLEAMAGGDLLRQEAGYFNPIRNIKKCANRLKEALADHGLILPLCILLSQQRDYIVFLNQAERDKQVEKTHLKLIGCFYDQCQDSLVQFSQFLSSTLTTEEYIHIFPKIDELVQVYHVSADVAFFLSRPMYAHHIQSKYDELRRADRNTKSAEKPSKTQRYLESIEYVMQPVIDLARTLHPLKTWEDISPLFYTTFWTLSMSDCFVPTIAYEKQRTSLKHKLIALDDNIELTSAKKKKEKEKLNIMLEKLIEEENKQKDHVQHVRARFEKEKDQWFPSKSKTKNDTITVFLQLCIFSRCLFTQIDAYYCAKFIQIINSLKTPNFSTIICYDRIFSDISYSIASLTDNEARRYGRFLLGLLETVMSWHSDPSIFDAECANHPGFLTVFRNNLNSTAANTANFNKQEQLDYENFRHVCHKWHYKLTKSFIVCLESDEYLQMRNSLIILTKILPHYPKLTAFSVALEKRVEKVKISERDKRQDLFTLASAYLGQLKIRKSSMCEESKFHLKEVVQPSTTETDKSKATNNTTSGGVTSSAPQAAFKQPNNPKQTTTNGSSQVVSSSQPQLTSKERHQPPVLPNTATIDINVIHQIKPEYKDSKDSVITSIVASTLASRSQSASNKNSKETHASETSTSSSSSSSSGQRRNQPQPSSSSNPTTPTTTTTNSPPPANTKSKDDSSSSTTKAAQTNGTNGSSRNGMSSTSSSSSSSKRSTSSTNFPPSPKTATNSPPRNGNNDSNSNRAEYSPASSVSSDDLPVTSPKRSHGEAGSGGGSNNHQHSNHGSGSHHGGSHSRSSSPVVKNSNPRSSLTKADNLGDKTKRVKLNEESSSQNGSKISSSSSSDTQTSSSSQSTTSSSSQSSTTLVSSQSSGISTITTTSSSSSGSSKSRKSSRERDRINSNASERETKEKKEHRKREHSSEAGSDLGDRKRSKSDDTKKKLSLVSTSSSSKRDSPDDLNLSTNSNGGASVNVGGSNSQQVINLNNSSSSSSGKHRDERRVLHDKSSSSSSSYKR